MANYAQATLFQSHTMAKWTLSINCLFAFLTGTFFRHREKGGKNEETQESASLQASVFASNSATSDLSSSDNDDDLSEPDEQRADGLGSWQRRNSKCMDILLIFKAAHNTYNCHTFDWQHTIQIRTSFIYKICNYTITKTFKQCSSPA